MIFKITRQQKVGWIQDESNVVQQQYTGNERTKQNKTKKKKEIK